MAKCSDLGQKSVLELIGLVLLPVLLDEKGFIKSLTFKIDHFIHP